MPVTKGYRSISLFQNPDHSGIKTMGGIERLYCIHTAISVTGLCSGLYFKAIIVLSIIHRRDFLSKEHIHYSLTLQPNVLTYT